MAAKKLTSVALSATVKARLDAQALFEGRSRSSLVEAILDKELPSLPSGRGLVRSEPAPVLRRRDACPCGVPVTALCVKCDR